MKKILAITLLVCSLSPHAATLGRLFFTPQQRAQIDADSLQNSEQKSTAFTVNGIVQKHGGARVVWLNGVAQTALPAQTNPASVSLIIPRQQKAVTLKVGEKIQLAPDAK